MFDYRGKHVFVAGGTSGINLGIAHGFAKCGATLSVLSRSREKVDAAVGALVAHGGEVNGYTADVRDYANIETALGAAHARCGPIDVLVSGASGNFPAPALGMSSNGFRAVVDINLLGTFNVLRAAFDLLRRPGASVINISAPQGDSPMELQMHVCAAKAGVDMLTRVGALEWGPLGVRINAVVPGPVADTEGIKRLAPTADLRRIVVESIPLQRLGDKDDIANCCLWLGSPLASYVTGAVIPVDGGWSLGGTSVASAGMNQLLSG